jgi:hypothetical protein
MIRHEYLQGAVGLALMRRAPLIPYLIQAYRAAVFPEREPPPDCLLQVYEPQALPACARWPVIPDFDSPGSPFPDGSANFGQTSLGVGIRRS